MAAREAVGEAGIVHHKTTRYRHKLKETDPVKYQEYLEKQRKRAKENRDKLKRELKTKNPNPEAIGKKTHILLMQRERQQKYETKKKEKGTCKQNIKQKAKSTIETRTQIKNKNKKEYNRERKREERENMTYQKKEWVKKKDRVRKAKKVELLKVKISRESTANATPFKSKKTEWNITSCVRKVIPKSPRKFATVVCNLIENASPQKKKELDRVLDDVHIPDVSLEAVKKTTEGKKALKVLAKSILNRSKRFIASNFKIDRRSLTRAHKPTQKRKSHYVNDQIKRFYKREDISRVLPQKRYATKDGPGYLMQISIQEAHAKFNNESSVKVGLGRFAAKRPRNVRKLSEKYREYCCCVYCMNIRNKILPLNRCMKDKSKKVSSEERLLHVLLCPKSDSEKFFKSDCVNQKCLQCQDYAENLRTYYKDIPENKTLSWTRWEYKKEAGKSKRILVTKTGAKSVLMEEFVKDVLEPSQGTTFVSHIHTAKWQSMQFSAIKEKISEKSVLQVMDFATNRGVKYQDEIKSVFYTAEQITMHPIVSYYQSTLGLIREAGIVISNDINHDYHAVEHFQKVVNQDLERKVGKTEQLFVFSDGCSSQYKSRGPFGVLAEMKVKVNRIFFGSEHGKGDCDAEIGVINRLVDRAITGQKIVINNALDMFTYCQEHLENEEGLSRRKFFFVSKSQIERSKENEAKTVQGTRKIHQVVNNPHNSSVLDVRDLSCFCSFCQSIGTQSCCSNKEYVNPFKEITLERPTDTHVKSTKKRKKVEKTTIPVKVLVNKTNSQQRPFKSANTQKVGRGTSNKENSFTWETLHHTMIECTTFEQLKDFENNISLPRLPPSTSISIVRNKRTVDSRSLDLVPKEDDLLQLYPSTIYGDGNCLSRCGSLFAYGTEERYLELRIRIVLELVRNQDLYLDHDILCKGCEMREGVTDVPKTFAMFSEHFLDQVLTSIAIKRIFEEEVLAVIQISEYMGAWQLAALATVLGRTVRSVYPNYGGQTVRKDLNRLFFPLSTGIGSSPPACIMWTNLNGDAIPEREWKPNHFVVLVPMLPPCETQFNVNVEEEEMDKVHCSFSSEESMNLSGLSGIGMLDSPIYVSEDTRSLEQLLEVYLPVPHSLETDSQLLETDITLPVPQSLETDITLPVPQSLETDITLPVPQSLETDITLPVPQSLETDITLPVPQSLETDITLPVPQSLETDITMPVPQSLEADITLPVPQSLEKDTTLPVPQSLEKDITLPVSQSLETDIIPLFEEPVAIPHPNEKPSKKSFQDGTYIKVQHGTNMYPAVVADWPWVSYFYPVRGKRHQWQLQETRHTVIFEDIVCVIPSPDLAMSGPRRFFYIFKDL